MAPKIAVLTIHGMGNQKPNYGDRLRTRLLRRLDGDVVRSLEWESIWYHGEFQGQQDAVWTRTRRHKIDQVKLRKFFLFYFGDATATELRPDQEGSVYQRVMRRVLGHLDALRERLDDEGTPLIIVAHSLGCQVISNYIWDAQKGIGIWRDSEPTEFQKCGTARYLVTSGCNIPLFVSGLPRIEAIDKPNEAFQWLNFYDRDDVLGWPLRPLSRGFPNSYESVVTRDIEINVGFTPLSHTGYWEDGDFVNPLASLVETLHRQL